MFELETIINGILNAVLTGSGVAVGTWISQRAIIKQIEKLETKLAQKKKKRGYS